MQTKNEPVKEEKQFGGGHCVLFWGEEDKTYAIIGKVAIGILTLGVLPLIWLIKKKKKSKTQNSTEQSAK